MKENEFFSFRQNMPFSNLMEEKIILGSSDSLYGKNYKKFEKSIFFAGFSYSKQQNPTATSRKRWTHKKHSLTSKLQPSIISYLLFNFLKEIWRKKFLTFTVDKFKKVKFVSLEMLINEGKL